MNVLMINPSHPSTPHISAVRAWRFSRELARLGHRVLLLTGDPPGDEREAAAPLASHDWREPFVQPCGPPVQPEPSQPQRTLRRRARTAVLMLRDGGWRGDWVRDAVAKAGESQPHFKSDVIWCTFGTLESVIAATRIAAAECCPWVLDVKDHWELFVPRGLRHLVAWRTRGWAAVTTNSQLNAETAAKWQVTTPTVIYSGVDHEFFPSADDAEATRDYFALNVVGAIYFSAQLERLLDGIRLWRESLPQSEKGKVILRYIGGDAAAVTTAVARCLPGVAFEYTGYLPAPDMARLCKAAAVNVYIANPKSFHHKLLELLACGRPVIGFPAERQESKDLAVSVGGRLMVAESPEAVTEILRTIHARWQTDDPRPAPVEFEQRFSWPVQARKLELVLSRAVTGQP